MTTTTNTAIERVVAHRDLIKSGGAKVQPGQAARFPDAASFGDYFCQGDLKIKKIEQLPKDMVFYTQITMEAAEDGEFLDATLCTVMRTALPSAAATGPQLKPLRRRHS